MTITKILMISFPEQKVLPAIVVVFLCLYGALSIFFYISDI